MQIIQNLLVSLFLMQEYPQVFVEWVNIGGQQQKHNENDWVI